MHQPDNYYTQVWELYTLKYTESYPVCYEEIKLQ